MCPLSASTLISKRWPRKPGIESTKRSDTSSVHVQAVAGDDADLAGILQKHLLRGAGAEAVDALLRFHVRCNRLSVPPPAMLHCAAYHSANEPSADAVPPGLMTDCRSCANCMRQLATVCRFWPCCSLATIRFWATLMHMRVPMLHRRLICSGTATQRPIRQPLPARSR